MLTGKQIEHYYKQNKIHIDDFIPEHIGPNSYDVRLGDELLTYDSNEYWMVSLDCKKNNPTIVHKIPEEGFILNPGKLYLGLTMEQVGSDYFVPMYEGRSSLARLGIQSHVSAGFGDIGFKSRWTLEIVVTHQVRVYPGMRIGQVYFHQIFTEEFDLSVLFSSNGASRKYIAEVDEMKKKGMVELYEGKYSEQLRPQSSKLFEDFDVNEKPNSSKNYKKLFLNNLTEFLLSFEQSQATSECWYTIYRIMVNETDDKAIIILGHHDEIESDDERNEEPRIYASYCCMSYDTHDFYLDKDSQMQGGFDSPYLFLMKRGNDSKWKRIYNRIGYDHYIRDGWGEIARIE